MAPPRDLIPIRKWLQEKELLKENPSPEEEKKSIDWVKRHMAVQLYSMKAGYTQVSRSEMDHAYSVFQTKYPIVHTNKERAALKLNSKVNAAKMFKQKYDLANAENRKAFYESDEGRNAIAFFFAAFLKEKPHAMLPNEVWEFVEPTTELKALLEANKNKIKLSSEVWALVNGVTPTNQTTVPARVPIVAAYDNPITTAKEQQTVVKKSRLDGRTKAAKTAAAEERRRNAQAAVLRAAAEQEREEHDDEEAAGNVPVVSQQENDQAQNLDAPAGGRRPRGGRGGH